LRSTSRGFKSYSGQKLRNNLGQVGHTYVPLSLSNITWYRPKGDALRLGRQPQAWRKVMVAYRRVDDIVICGLTACTPGSAPSPTLVTSMGSLYLLPLNDHESMNRVSSSRAAAGALFTRLIDRVGSWHHSVPARPARHGNVSP